MGLEDSYSYLPPLRLQLSKIILKVRWCVLFMDKLIRIVFEPLYLWQDVQTQRTLKKKIKAKRRVKK